MLTQQWKYGCASAGQSVIITHKIHNTMLKKAMRNNTDIGDIKLSNRKS